MTNKKTDENRGEGGLFIPGCKPGPGRPKGSKNLFTMTLKQAFEESFWQAGGVEFLVAFSKSDPSTYAKLLMQLIPRPAPEAEPDNEKPYIDPDEQ